MILLKYEYKNVLFFGDGEYETVYELTMLKSWIFGLFTKEVKMNYKISMFGSIEEYERHWDKMIETRSKIK